VGEISESIFRACTFDGATNGSLKRLYIGYCKLIEQSNKKLSYRRVSTRRRSLCCSRSFKVIYFGTNRRPICDFVSVDNNNNWHLISYRYLVIAQYWSNWSNYRFWQELPVASFQRTRSA